MDRIWTFSPFERHVRALGIAGTALAVLGTKIWLIALYGSPTPFWDQWVGEAAHTFVPYFNGTLTFADLLAPHNEHRIGLSRAATLGLTVATGRWDPILQMLLNAAVHTTAIALLMIVLSRPLGAAGTLLLAAFALPLFAIPFGWENLLWAFQLPFYLLLLLVLLSLYMLTSSRAWTFRWWIGTLLAVLTYFCIASGALTLLAFVVLAGLQMLAGQRKGARELAGAGLHLAIAIVILADVRSVSASGQLGVRSIAEWLTAIFTVRVGR